MSKQRCSSRFSTERRRALKIVGRTAGCLAGASLLSSVGCAAGEERVAIALADLPIGERVRVLDGENPVELVRTAGGVEARSLWCTHSGCEVHWKPESQEYYCPCHDGFFDVQGNVVAGPPPRRLQAYPVTVTETEVLLGVESDAEDKSS